MAPRLLIELLRDRYSTDDLRRVQAMLDEHDTLAFARLRTGLFSAATIEGADRSSGYHFVWSRDNVYVGWAHFVAGKMQEAADVARALLTFCVECLEGFHVGNVTISRSCGAMI